MSIPLLYILVLLVCFHVEFIIEFRALEVALEAICSFFDVRTREREADTYPALDELTSKFSSFPFKDEWPSYMLVHKKNLALYANEGSQWEVFVIPVSLLS